MKISVIVPIYNVEKYLIRCLDSIDRQSFQDYEVLLINDGTKDSSGRIAWEYCMAHPKFHYYEKENGGLGSARNYGIDRASGEYLVFVDSDDWVESEYLQKLYTASVETDSDIAMCGITRVWENGKKQTFNSGFSKTAVYDNIHDVIIKTSNVAWNKIYRRELFDGIRYPERITYEDMACTPRVMIKAKRIAYIEDLLYNYFWREASITVSTRNRVNKDILTAFDILENSPIENEKDILSSIFLKVVICSYLWSLYANNEDYCERKHLLDRLMTEYKDAFVYYDLALLSGRLRMFVQLCKTQNDGLLRAYVRCIVGLQNTKMSLKSGLHR